MQYSNIVLSCYFLIISNSYEQNQQSLFLFFQLEFVNMLSTRIKIKIIVNTFNPY